MAGLYADVPGPQIMYDRDGNGFYYSGTTALVALSQGDLNIHNGTSGGSGSRSNDGWVTVTIGIILPELYDIVGWFNNGSGAGNGNYAFETSPDTTNGQDGTWTSRYANWSTGSTFRSSITAVSWAGMKGFRWSAGNGSANKQYWYQLHLYGSPSASSLTAVPGRLRVWHPTLDQLISGPAFDFADVARSAPALTKTFRIKNNSATQTVNSIVLSTGALTDTSPTVLGVETIDYNGSGYASTQTISSLAPGAISSLCTLKLSPGASATLGLWRQRVLAVAGSWT